MLQKLKIFTIVVLVVNLVTVDVFLFSLWKEKNNEEKIDLVDKECPINCNNVIDKKISAALIPAETLTPTVTLIPTVIAKKAETKKIRSTQYIPIPGSGITLENKWADLSGTEFYISTDDYSNLIGAYFEANMKLLNGNGLAYLRLFDVTAGIEVWGSEISTNSQNFTSVSSEKLTIRNGTHLYRVQAKSLTADTTVFNSGRIKMILEN